MAKNPPPLLSNLGATPAEKADVRELKSFLQLIFDSAGGGSSDLGDDVESLKASVSTLEDQNAEIQNNIELYETQRKRI